MARARRAAAPHSDSSEREPSSDGSYTPPPSYKSKRSSRSTSASGGKGKAAVLARGSSEDEYTSTDSSASDVAGHSRAPRSRRLRGVGRGGRGKYEKVARGENEDREALLGKQQSNPNFNYYILGGIGLLIVMSLVIIGLLVFNDNTGGGGGGGESETTTSSESGFSSSSETSSESGSSSSSSGEKTTSSKTTSSTSETTTATKPTSTANIEGDMPGISKSHMHVNGVVIGWLPDEGDAGGEAEVMTDYNAILGMEAGYYGWYAQLPEDGAEWDGQQLLSIKDDVKKSGAVFQPAIMPTKGWKGLTEDDDTQAQSIAKVLKKFTDDGIYVEVRFAHEVNWYQSDGTYQGDADDFKEGYKVVAAALADNDMVSMFHTPNVAASLDDYVAFHPEDESTVDIIGIDYYPKSLSKGTEFLDAMLAYYERYCGENSTTVFSIGETGLGWEGDVEERLSWLHQATSKETLEKMPRLKGVSWFNFQKGHDFKIVDTFNAETTDKFLKWWEDNSDASPAPVSPQAVSATSVIGGKSDDDDDATTGDPSATTTDEESEATTTDESEERRQRRARRRAVPLPTAPPSV